MNVIKYNLFFNWNYEKEEQWLNELSRQGLQLKSVAYVRYEFEEDDTKCYEYRLEHLDEAPSDIKSINYIESLKESNIEYVCSFEQWVYFRRETSLGSFELLADPDAKIGHYSRMITLSGIVIFNILVLLINNLCVIFNFYILNIVISVLLALLLIIGIFTTLKLYSRIIKLKKEKRIRK